MLLDGWAPAMQSMVDTAPAALGPLLGAGGEHDLRQARPSDAVSRTGPHVSDAEQRSQLRCTPSCTSCPACVVLCLGGALSNLCIPRGNQMRRSTTAEAGRAQARRRIERDLPVARPALYHCLDQVRLPPTAAQTREAKAPPAAPAPRGANESRGEASRKHAAVAVGAPAPVSKDTAAVQQQADAAAAQRRADAAMEALLAEVRPAGCALKQIRTSRRCCCNCVAHLAWHHTSGSLVC